MIELNRRALLRGALFVAAAPMIVKAASIMPVRAPKLVVVAKRLRDGKRFIITGWDEHGVMVMEEVTYSPEHCAFIPESKVNFRTVERISIA